MSRNACVLMKFTLRQCLFARKLEALDLTWCGYVHIVSTQCDILCALCVHIVCAHSVCTVCAHSVHSVCIVCLHITLDLTLPIVRPGDKAVLGKTQ